MTDAVAAPQAPVAAPNTAPTTNGAPGATNAAQAPEAPATGETAAQRERRLMRAAELGDVDFEFIIDGKPQKLTAEEAFRRIQRAESANKRYAEAKRLATEAQRQQERLASAIQDPNQFRLELQAAGYSPRQIAEAILQAEQADAQLTPEQRRVRELEAELADRQAFEEEAQQRAQQAQVVQAQQVYHKHFTEVIDSVGVPPEHPSRALLVQALARETYRVMEEEGRRWKKGEAREFVSKLIAPFARPLSDDERVKAITAADVARWQEMQRAAKPQAAPQLDRSQQPRDEAGRFAPQAQDAPRGQPYTENGRTIVRNMSKLWGDRM